MANSNKLPSNQYSINFEQEITENYPQPNWQNILLPWALCFEICLVLQFKLLFDAGNIRLVAPYPGIRALLVYIQILILLEHAIRRWLPQSHSLAADGLSGAEGFTDECIAIKTTLVFGLLILRAQALPGYLMKSLHLFAIVGWLFARRFARVASRYSYATHSAWFDDLSTRDFT